MNDLSSLDELFNRGKVYLGEGACHAIVIIDRPRHEDNGRPLIEIWVSDDDSWFLKMSFSSYWLLSLINALEEAQLHVVFNTRCTRQQPHDGPCNGLPCEHITKLLEIKE